MEKPPSLLNRETHPTPPPPPFLLLYLFTTLPPIFHFFSLVSPSLYPFFNHSKPINQNIIFFPQYRAPLGPPNTPFLTHLAFPSSRGVSSLPAPTYPSPAATQPNSTHTHTFSVTSPPVRPNRFTCKNHRLLFAQSGIDSIRSGLGLV